MNESKIICPVCGVINAVGEIPWNEENFSSQDICPCCGTHYGEDDWGKNKEDINKNHINLRKKWIEGGMKWWSKSNLQPENWNPIEQLKNIM